MNPRPGSALLPIAIALSLSMGAITAAWAQADAPSVIETYADIAEAKYQDSLAAARSLEEAVQAFLAQPSEQTQNAAKEAWLEARIPYQQSEVYRFGNPIVDAWEGRVNAWPLDEGLIDYVDATYGLESDENSLYTANVIANPTIEINGKSVDASSITPEFLSQSLHEAGDIEANVATGYHAIEFLLWGQDLNGTGPGAGARAYTDFSLDACTNGNCDRRRAYLEAATQLLITDLAEMAANWGPDGAARRALANDPQASLSAILIGMGSLSYGELAGERMKLGLLLNDPEEEHDCFSDNTHNSHLYDALGIQNVYLGTYRRLDGSVIDGPSVSDLIGERDLALDTELKTKLAATLTAMQTMVERAETVEAYDQMIGEGNAQGNAVVQAAIDGLIDQTRSIERAVATLQLNAVELEGSDSLDDPQAVFE